MCAVDCGHSDAPGLGSFDHRLTMTAGSRSRDTTTGAWLTKPAGRIRSTMATAIPPPAVSPPKRGPGTRELLQNLTMREVRSQFKRTALGRAWSFINPLATIAIYSVVFGFILKSPITPGTNSGIHLFALFLAAALIPWTFFAGAILTGMGSIVSNEGLLSKVYFPRFILPVSSILAIAVTFAIELGLLTVIMAIAGGIEVFLFLPGLIAMMAIMITFCIGLSLMLSIALVYFRDTQHFMALFIQLWFYATPIIYSQTLVQSLEQQLRESNWNLFGEPFPLLFLYNLNPATLFTGAFRTMLYDFAWPHWTVWLGSLAWALVVLWIGSTVFRKFSARMVEEL